MSPEEKKGWDAALKTILDLAETRQKNWEKIKETIPMMGGWRAIEAAHFAGFARDLMGSELAATVTASESKRAIEALFQKVLDVYDKEISGDYKGNSDAVGVLQYAHHETWNLMLKVLAVIRNRPDAK